MGAWRWSVGGAVLVAAGLTQVAGLVWVRRRRDSAAASGLATLLVSIAVWDVANGLELFAAQEAGRVLWGGLKYLGIAALPAAWWTFMLQYLGRARRLPTWALVGLAVVPGALGFVLIDPATRAAFRSYPSSGATDVANAGVLFWPFVGYTALLLLGGLGAFAVRMWRLSPLYRRQSVVLVWYAALPLAAIVSFNVGLMPWRTLDPTPLAFSIGTLMLAWGVFRYRLLQLRPVARGKVIETLPDAVVVLDLAGHVIDLNHTGEALLRAPARTVIGRPVDDLVDVPAGRHAGPVEVGGRSYELLVSELTDRLRRPLGRLLLGRDVTEERRAERARREAEARFRAAFDSAVIGMALVTASPDGRGRLLEVNAALCALTGYRQDELLGYALGQRFDLADLAGDSNVLAALLSGTDSTLRRETTLRRADGSAVSVLLGVAQVTGVDPSYLIVQAEDITERKLAEQRLTQQALHDSLTGLANRALFLDRLSHALVARPRRDQSVAVLLIDLNGFKAVNDAFGHAAGDRLLQLVAGRLAIALRPADTIARLGGDEFAVVLPELGRPYDASVIAERVAAALGEPYLLEGGQVSTPPSIGIAVAGPGDDADSLLRDADTAMYVAKRRGRSGVERFTPSLRAHLRERRQLQADLRRALQNGRLDLAFQPIVELPSRRVAGVEALLRWPHPRRGLLHPAQFLSVAESAGLTVDIGQWVLGQALRRVAQARSVASSPSSSAGSLVVAVNVAPRQLSLPGFATVVADALAAAGVHPASLCLEVTENELLDSPEVAATALRQVREMGVRVALDDFGTGSSSLSHIRTLPIDVIKIDRSFIRDVVAQPADRSIVRSIIDLGHALGHLIIAEGVETEDQLALLVEFGCDQAQGFLFGVPVSEQWLPPALASPLP